MELHGTQDFLRALALVLCAAAVTTVVFQRLRQPVVLGYLISGLIIGPHVPVPLVADPRTVQTLAELGVILLMFSLGLEFSLRKLFQVGPTAGLTAVIQCSVMVWLGFVVGRAFGWRVTESIFAGAIIAISSTTIIAKAFDEQGIRGRLRSIVVGILVVEDLIAILLMATLTAVASGAGLSAGALAMTVGRLAAFLLGLVVIGLLIVPRTVRYIVRLKRPETTLVASVGFCFAIAFLAHEFGYSVALGAFLAGSLIAESGSAKEIEHLVEPVKDVFAAIFFVSVGMLIDPALLAKHWGAIAVFTVVVIVGKVVSVSLGAFLTGNGTRMSVQAGMSLAQIGEFSFIIATLGLTLNATGDFIYPIAVSVSALTTLTTPWLIKASGPVANFVDRKLPRPLQTFVTLYGSWIERLSSSTASRHSHVAPIRRMFRLLLLDAALLGGLVIGTSLFMPKAVLSLQEHLGLQKSVAKLFVWSVAGTLAVPFCVGIFQLARRLGVAMAERALPAHGGRVDLAAAPRRALVVTLQLGVVLLVGIPLTAVTQPFIPGFQGALLLLVLLAVMGVTFWRSATNLEGHVRAGAQAIVEALTAQSRSETLEEPTTDSHKIDALHQLLPGIGEPVPYRLLPSSPAVGKSLASLNLRGQTGATVLAIRRGNEGVLVPTAQDVLHAGDVLALAGSHDAVAAAQALLSAQPPPDAAESQPPADASRDVPA